MLEQLPWFEAGQPLHNWMLHETDFYDEVEQIWGRRWGAEGIGRLREVLVSRPTENETRPEYAQEWQYYYSTAAGNADLGRLQAQFDEYYQVLARQRRAGQLRRAAGAGDRRLRLPEEPGHARRRRAGRARRGDHPPHGPRLLAARARGDLVKGADRAGRADLPDDPRPRDRRAGRRAVARSPHVRVQQQRGRQRGGAAPDRVRAQRSWDRDGHHLQPGLGRHAPVTATSARPTPTCS